MNLESNKCIVVGGGLVGSLWAIYLARRNVKPCILEKRADPRLSEAEGRSINLVVTSRGIHALKKVGLWDRVSEICVPVMGRMMHTIDGQTHYQPYGRDASECNYSVSRLQLNRLLIEEAQKRGAHFEFDSIVESVDFESKQIRLHGKMFHYDFLFGTDGSGSQVRHALERLRDNETQLEMLSHGYKELVIPSQAGEYAMERECLHIWPRGDHMLMALANLDGSFTATLYIPWNAFEALDSKTKLLAYFKKQYPDATNLMPNLESEFFENPTGKLGTVRTTSWYFEDSALLLGDASHGIVPFFGQGMNSGFEDCSILDEQLDNSDFSLENFYNHRKKDTDAIADMALENFHEMSAKVGDPQFLLEKQIEHQIELWFPDRYRSRYGMVCYTQIPYSIAQAVGRTQSMMIHELGEKIQSVSELDRGEVDALIRNRLEPVYKEFGIQSV